MRCGCIIYISMWLFSSALSVSGLSLSVLLNFDIKNWCVQWSLVELNGWMFTNRTGVATAGNAGLAVRYLPDSVLLSPCWPWQRSASGWASSACSTSSYIPALFLGRLFSWFGKLTVSSWGQVLAGTVAAKKRLWGKGTKLSPEEVCAIRWDLVPYEVSPEQSLYFSLKSDWEWSVL